MNSDSGEKKILETFKTIFQSISAEWSKSKREDKIYTVIGGVFLLLLLVAGVRSVVTPQSCEQAREVQAKAEKEWDKAVDQATVKYDEKAHIRTQATLAEKYEAERKMRDRCY